MLLLLLRVALVIQLHVGYHNTFVLPHSRHGIPLHMKSLLLLGGNYLKSCMKSYSIIPPDLALLQLYTHDKYLLHIPPVRAGNRKLVSHHDLCLSAYKDEKD